MRGRGEWPGERVRIDVILSWPVYTLWQCQDTWRGPCPVTRMSWPSYPPPPELSSPISLSFSSLPPSLPPSLPFAPVSPHGRAFEVACYWPTLPPWIWEIFAIPTFLGSFQPTDEWDSLGILLSSRSSGDSGDACYPRRGKGAYLYSFISLGVTTNLEEDKSESRGRVTMNHHHYQYLLQSHAMMISFNIYTCRL